MTEKKQTIGERFDTALKAVYTNGNPTQACVDELGLSQPSVDRARKSDKMTPTIRKFAKLKNISLDWLERGSGDIFLVPEDSRHSRFYIGDGKYESEVEAQKEGVVMVYGEPMDRKLSNEEWTMLADYRDLPIEKKRKVRQYILSFLLDE